MAYKTWHTMDRRWYTYDQREKIIDRDLTKAEAEARVKENPELRVGEVNLG